MCSIFGDYVNVWGWYELLKYNYVLKCDDLKYNDVLKCDDELANGYVRIVHWWYNVWDLTWYIFLKYVIVLIFEIWNGNYSDIICGVYEGFMETFL